MARPKFENEEERKAFRAKQDAAREASTDYTNDRQVLTLAQWCRLNNFSIATGKTILASNNGPKILQLTARRIGIRVGDNARWQEQRLRA